MQTIVDNYQRHLKNLRHRVELVKNRYYHQIVYY